jgi:hypothetical protein
MMVVLTMLLTQSDIWALCIPIDGPGMNSFDFVLVNASRHTMKRFSVVPLKKIPFRCVASGLGIVRC